MFYLFILEQSCYIIYMEFQSCPVYRGLVLPLFFAPSFAEAVMHGARLLLYLSRRRFWALAFAHQFF